MKIHPRALIVSGVLVVAIVVAVTVATVTRQTEQPALAPVSVMTTFPDLAAPLDQPQLDGLDDARPPAGTIEQVQGPFDDRFQFEGLTFDGAAAEGRVRVTSDVSELLELEVVAGFYDANGALLGVSSFVHHATGAAHAHSDSPEQTEEFHVAVPAGITGQAVSAAVGVVVLVNE